MKSYTVMFVVADEHEKQRAKEKGVDELMGSDSHNLAVVLLLRHFEEIREHRVRMDMEQKRKEKEAISSDSGDNLNKLAQLNSQHSGWNEDGDTSVGGRLARADEDEKIEGLEVRA